MQQNILQRGFEYSHGNERGLRNAGNSIINGLLNMINILQNIAVFLKIVYVCVANLVCFV